MPRLPTGRTLLNADKILIKTGLGSGMVYADFGCGSHGHFISAASHIVGETGKVFAVDILKSCLTAIESRARLEQLSNLDVIWGDFGLEGGIGLPKSSLDFVSCVNVAPALMTAPKAFSEIRRVLKAGGKLVVIDWNFGAESLGPTEEMRVAPEKAKDKAVKAGFRLLDEFRAGPNHWGLLLTL